MPTTEKVARKAIEDLANKKATVMARRQAVEELCSSRGLHRDGRNAHPSCQSESNLVRP
jgi:hypothetical protein